MTEEELKQFCMEYAKDEWDTYVIDNHQDLEFCLRDFSFVLLKKLNVKLEE